MYILGDFDAILSKIFKKLFLSDILLLVFRKATYLCILILYPANMNSFISANSFSVESVLLSHFSRV